MATDPGDLVLDPTCGSGTTATVAEQWGRRGSRLTPRASPWLWPVPASWAPAIPTISWPTPARASLRKPRSLATAPVLSRAHGDIRHGFVYERVPHITLKSIANNAEIDVIWEKWQATLEPLRDQSLNAALEARIVAGMGNPRGRRLQSGWPDAARRRSTPNGGRLASRGRRRSTRRSPPRRSSSTSTTSRTRTAEKVRVAGPFTVESLSPHRVLGVDENDELIDQVYRCRLSTAAEQSFPQMILENLKIAGVQQAHKEDRITFTALTPGPATWLRRGSLPRGRRLEKRAAIFIGPEFGTVSAPDLVAAAREAGDAGFDVLIACAFNYEAHATRVQQARPHPRAQGSNECRPAHGGGPQEHRQGQPVRDLRRARHRASSHEATAACGSR